MKTLKLCIVFLLFASIYSCSNDDNSSSDDEDIRQQVENFVTPDLVDTLNDLGFNFNNGEDTPNIEGRFSFNPRILGGTNIEDDVLGNSYVEFIADLSNIDPELRQLTFQSVSSSGSLIATGASTFYSAIGNSFSIYARFNIVTNNQAYTILRALSGDISDDGIVNGQVVLIMQENNNISGLLENGQGRLFVDEDGTALRQF